MRRIVSGMVLLGMISLCGCGYSTRSALPARWRTIAIPHFANKIDLANASKRSLYIPLLEVKVRNGVVSRFQYDGNLRVADENVADLVLTGELIDYVRDVLRYTDDEDPLEYRIRISVNLKLTEGKGGPVVWEENGFSGETSYFVSGTQAKSESTAIDAAVTDLSRRIVERLIENW